MSGSVLPFRPERTSRGYRTVLLATAKTLEHRADRGEPVVISGTLARWLAAMCRDFAKGR